MRKVAFAFFFLLLIAVIGIFTGIFPISTLNPFQETTKEKVDVGFAVVNQSEEILWINFSQIIVNLPTLGVNWEDDDAKNIATHTANSTNIQLIRGYNLNMNGDATTWIAIVEQPDQVSLVTFDRFGEKVDPWQGSYPEKKIFPDQVKTPQEIFSLNRDIIFPAPVPTNAGVKEMTLAGETYYLTISGQEKIRYLEFNAISGVLTSSND